MIQPFVDVVIVGAGLSGLQTALDLHEAGLSVHILEARDRVGGKTNSVQRPDGRGIQEIGAAWLNNSNQSHVWGYCKKFGLSAVVQNIQGKVACEDEEGNCHFFRLGETPNFEAAEVRDIRALQSKVEALTNEAASFQDPIRSTLDQLTFETWCRNAGAGKRAIQTATLWCRGALGQEPTDVSALAFFEVSRGALGVINLRSDGEHGAQHLRLKEGTQAIAKQMAMLLPANSIQLNTPVRTITQVSTSLHAITTAAGALLFARKVVVSVPGPAYRLITFNPPLPPARQTYNMATRYGCFVKYICLFKSPFWRDKGCCGLSQSFRGPVNHCRDTSVDDADNYALTCFLSAMPGRRWLAMDEQRRKEAVLHQLGSLFDIGAEAVHEQCVGTLTSQWTEDPWAGWGCPFAVPPPGVLGDGKALTEPFGGWYFVGTELTSEWRGYMEGALRSGKRGASQILADLQTPTGATKL